MKFLGRAVIWLAFTILAMLAYNGHAQQPAYAPIVLDEATYTRILSQLQQTPYGVAAPMVQLFYQLEQEAQARAARAAASPPASPRPAQPETAPSAAAPAPAQPEGHQ